MAACRYGISLLVLHSKRNSNYNIARVLALHKSYWAAMNKIFIYARPCVNKMTWAFFFTWLQSFRPVKLQCSFPSLWNMEETSERLPNSSIGIDLSGPHPTSNKNKAQKNSRVVSVFEIIFKWRLSSFGFDFLHFSSKFWTFHSQLSVNWLKCSRSNQSIKCGVFFTSQ